MSEIEVLEVDDALALGGPASYRLVRDPPLPLMLARAVLVVLVGVGEIALITGLALLGLFTILWVFFG